MGPTAGPQSAATIAFVPDLAIAGYPVLDRSGGVERVIAGPLRCELTANQVTFADDRFAFPITGATRVKTGWLFIAADGVVARADTFLGPLHPLGHVPRPTENMSGDFLTSQGRMAITTQDPHASLWTTDGSAPIAPAQSAPPGVALSAAFVDADHGMIVIDGGALFVTRDGAVSFERVDLGDAAAAAVVADRGALYVTTSSDIRIFDRDGNVIDASQSPSPGLAVTRVGLDAAIYQDSDPEVHRRVFTAALRRYGGIAVESWRGVIAPDGRALVAVEHALESLSGAPSGADLTKLEHYLPCSAARWGQHIALACFDGLFRADATTLRPALVTAKATGSVELSQDGVHAAWPCVFAAKGPTSLCMFTGSQVIQRQLEGYRLLGIRGDAAVVWMRSPGADAIALIDAETGTDRRSFAARLPPAAPELGDEGWSLSADGAAVTAVARAAVTNGPASRERYLVRIALSDGAVTTALLPAGATRAGFVSVARGIAAGEDASTTWLTHDGGAHWQARHGVSGVNRFITCRDGRCAIDGMVVVSFDQPIPHANDRVIASSADPVARPPLTRTVGLACATDDVPRPGGGHEADLGGGELDENGRVRFEKPNADVTLHVTSDGRWDVVWRGRDWLGPYTSRGAAGAVAPGSEGGWYQLARATRDGVVIARSGEPNQLVWFPAGGLPRVIDDADLVPDGVEDILMLPDGSLAVLLRFKAPSQADRDYYRLLHFDRNGNVLARRTYHWQWGRNAAIAFSERTVGVQWAETDPTRPRWFLPIDAAGASHELAKLDVGSIPICKTRARTAGAVSIGIEGPALQDWPSSTGKSFARVYLRDEEPACIQAVEARQPLLGGRDVFVAASTHGDLRTTLDLRAIGKLRTLRCGIASAHDPGESAVGLGESVGAWTAGAP